MESEGTNVKVWVQCHLPEGIPGTLFIQNGPKWIGCAGQTVNFYTGTHATFVLLSLSTLAYYDAFQSRLFSESSMILFFSLFG